MSIAVGPDEPFREGNVVSTFAPRYPRSSFHERGPGVYHVLICLLMWSDSGDIPGHKSQHTLQYVLKLVWPKSLPPGLFFGAN